MAYIPGYSAIPAGFHRSEPMEELPLKRRDTAPRDAIEALLRLRACNKAQLAARLGISDRTLSRWIAEGPTPAGRGLISALLIATLRAADHADELAQWRGE